MIRITTLGWVPEPAQGYVRDIIPRWALEEIGQPYEVRLIGRDETASAAYLKRQPFGQVPVYEENGLILFESGAIALHIAEKSEVLLSKDATARARVVAWMFAAMNSIDPLVRNFQQVMFFSPDDEWARLRRPAVVAALNTRLDQMAGWLEGRDYLETTFSAADILMTVILRNIGPDELVTGKPNLREYIRRCEARPAFKRALEKHLATFVNRK